jgi:hypothetical protein
MAVPATHHITLHRGSQFRRELRWKDELGAVIDLTGYSGELSIKDDFDDAAALLTLTDGSGLTFGADPNVIIVMTAAQLDGLSLAGKVGVYTLECWAGGVDKQQIFRGEIRLKKRATIWS